jgi:hypothetical protein
MDESITVRLLGTSLRRKNRFGYPVDVLKLDAIGKRRRRIDRHGFVG